MLEITIDLNSLHLTKFPADLVKITEEIPYEKLHFLCSAKSYTT